MFLTMDYCILNKGGYMSIQEKFNKESSVNTEIGLHLIMYIRENILNTFGSKCKIPYIEIEKFCDMLNDNIEKSDFLTTYTGVTFTKTFTPKQGSY